jgi:subtilisin family serine protease
MRSILCGLVVLVAAIIVPSASTSTAAPTTSASTYIVLYKQAAVPGDVATTIRNSGGTLVYSYSQIGVAIARSSSPSFRDSLLKDQGIENASSTAGFAYQLPDEQADTGDSSQGDLPNTPASDSDTFSSLQWDMRQIKAPEAHAVTGGSPAVLAGDIDTGLDYNHPDLRHNVDSADSANCLSGAPVAGSVAANDDNGHGTHTAGTIAAAANGIGIVGVAPNVRIAAIKSGTAAGFFFPEAVVCAFMWAGSHHFDVTNNSYFADPYEYNCKNDPTQRAIWQAESRAILYAEQQGVTVVAAEGNDSDDTAHAIQDRTSPDDTTPQTRTIHNDCAIIPAEVPGVIGVSATGDLRLKSFYSNFGVGVTEVAAPGGDSILQRTAAAPNGRVLSTWPATKGCSRKVTETGDPVEPTAVYCYLQGTSMASPQVTGTVALIISEFGTSQNPQNGKLRPGQVAALLQQTADPQACPDDATLALYAPFPGFNSELPQTCQGGPGDNSWYGKGIIDALNAVTHTAGH